MRALQDAVGEFVKVFGEMGRLQRDAADLGADLEVARAVRSTDLATWRAMPYPVARTMVLALCAWVKADKGRDPLVTAPSTMMYSSSWFLSQVLRCVLAGILTAEERQALQSAG